MADEGAARRGTIPPTRRGYAFDEVASALQKCIRRGQEEDALYWALELDASGYTQYVWRRLLVVLSEDCGLAEPHLPATIHALHQNALHLEARRKGTGRLQLVHAVLLLARAKKSRMVNNALVAIGSDETVRQPPDVAVDRHTKRGRAMGRGFEHFWDQGNWLVDPETGELTPEGSLPDPYLDRAREVRTGKRTRQAEQLMMEESDE